MAQNITAQDATAAITSSLFRAAKCTKLVVSIKWTGITGATGATKYSLKQSNISAVGGDPVPAISGGLALTNGSDSVTFEVTSPADKFEHSYVVGGASAGTFDVTVKVLY